METESENAGKFFYANGLEVAASPFDFSLKFIRNGTPDAFNKPGQNYNVIPVLADKFVVSMSPVLAKLMLKNLTIAIDNYERANSAIVIPKELEVSAGATKAASTSREKK